MVENFLTRRYFDQQAGRWDCQPLPSAERIYNLLRCLDFSWSRSILDLGCGTGILFPFLSRLTQGRAVIFACDFSEAMTRLAVQRCCQRLFVICAFAQYLPFRDSSLDLIVAFRAFPHIHNKKLAIQECYRVLKPGGEIAILHLHSSHEINSIHQQMDGVVKHHCLPSGKCLGKMLQTVGFELKNVIDRTGKYLVRGIKAA